MDLNLLRLFAVIYEEGSLSAAAQRLHLTQPTVSHSCNKLRRHYGDPLFIRNGRGVTPSTFADSLYQSIAEHLTAMENAALVDFDPATSTHNFTICLSDIGESVFLPAILTALHDTAPGITIDVLSVDVDNAPDLLSRGAVDAVITSGELPGPTYSDVIRTDRYCFVHHPQATDALQAGRLLDVDFVFAHPSLGHYLPVQKLLDEGTISAQHSTVQSFSSLPHILARFPGATIAPELIARHWKLLSPGLAISPLPATVWKPEVRLHRRASDPSSALAWFYTFVLEISRNVGDATH